MVTLTPKLGTERHIRCIFPVPIDLIDNRFIEVCSDHRLFFEEDQFCHKKWYRQACPTPPPAQHRNQIDDIAIGHQWCVLMEDWRLFLFTPMDLYYPLVVRAFVCAQSVVASTWNPPVLYRELHMTANNFIFSPGFQLSCQRNKTSRIPDNTGKETKKPCSHREIICNTSYHVNLRNAGYSWLVECLQIRLSRCHIQINAQILEISTYQELGKRPLMGADREMG